MCWQKRSWYNLNCSCCLLGFNYVPGTMPQEKWSHIGQSQCHHWGLALWLILHIGKLRQRQNLLKLTADIQIPLACSRYLRGQSAYTQYWLLFFVRQKVERKSLGEVDQSGERRKWGKVGGHSLITACPLGRFMPSCGSSGAFKHECLWVSFTGKRPQAHPRGFFF